MIVSQTRIRGHVLQFTDPSLAAKFKPFSAAILAAGGVAATAPSIDRMRAIVGWFAQHAIHPSSYLHPNGTTLNTGSLPSGETWATFNAAFDNGTATTRDQAYWYGLYPNGVVMLQRLIGTVANDGTITDDGMLTEASGQWRIRNFANYRAPQCTLQCKMAQVVLAAQGILAVDISMTGHDPMMAYESETGRWLYIDPTFGEMQLVDDVRQTPFDLLMISLAGDKTEIAGEKLPGAAYIPASYFPDSANGTRFMTIYTAPRWATSGVSDRVPYHFGSLPSLSPTTERAATTDELMPELGCGFAGVKRLQGVIEARLVSNWPGHTGFSRSLDGGVTWAACSSTDYADGLLLQYRSVDASGYTGLSSILQN